MMKANKLEKLVSLRRQETHPKYRLLHTFDGGRWDFPFVVPWTKSACNLDAKLMVIGQDWASEAFLTTPKYNTPERVAARERSGQDEYLATNKRLKSLLHKHFHLDFSQTYATDVLIYIKPGNMSGNVPMIDLQYCAEKYTLEQIRIIKPQMAICLGAKTFNAVRTALKKQPGLPFSEACTPTAHTVDTDESGTRIHAVPHTGGQGHANAGGDKNVDEIWARIAADYGS